MTDTHPLLRKLECFVAFSPDDMATVSELPGQIRTVPARHALTDEGSSPASVMLILDGIGCRTKKLPDGRRQVISFLFPGDLTDPHSFVPRSLDHSAETVTPCEVMEVGRDVLVDLMARPAIREALNVSAVVEEAIIKEWLINVGRRASAERLAHLLCESVWRLHAIGLGEDDRFPFPITQKDLADCTCLSVVHVNRILQEFRASGLVTLLNGELIVHDLDRLRRVGGFSDDYLELAEGFAPPGSSPSGSADSSPSL